MFRRYRPLKALGQFHRAFGVKAEDHRNEDALMLRLRLITEEFQEVEAELDLMIDDDVFASAENLTKELADLLYVVYGTAEVFGLPLEKAFEEVHRSNMSKLGSDGKPVYRADGKVLKGPNYRPADMRGVLTGEWL